MINIKVIGPGCTNCIKLENLCYEVVRENQYQANIEKISDVKKIAEMGIMLTPTLIINDKVFASGKIPTKASLKHWIDDLLKDIFY